LPKQGRDWVNGLLERTPAVERAPGATLADEARFTRTGSTLVVEFTPGTRTVGV